MADKNNNLDYIKNQIENALIEKHTRAVYQKLKSATVTIAGLGGLGSNVAVSLARIGVGTLYVIDFDKVEYSNLNRQYYFLEHIGMKKIEAICDVIDKINPLVQVIGRDDYVNEENALELCKNSSIIVEAFDNPESKANLINAILINQPDKSIISASGMAGFGSSNTIITKRIQDNFYVIGDGISSKEVEAGLMAPRVSIAANHQANLVVELLLNKE